MRDLIEGVRNVWMCSAEDCYLHDSTASCIDRPVSSARYIAQLRRTTDAPCAAGIAGGLPALSALSTSFHWATWPRIPIAAGSAAPVASSLVVRGGGVPSTSQRRICPCPSSITPVSVCKTTVAGEPGGVAVEVLICPNAPLVKRRVATVVSSASMSCPRVAY